jgi:Uma2 family endonuclease
MNAMAKVARRMTADEYLAAPDDGRRTWLVDGEVVLNQPANLHQVVLLDVIAALLAWESAAPDRGRVSLPLDVKLDEYNVFGPDVMWYAEGRVPELHDPRPYPLPDLAVEVRSPSTWRYDIGAKQAAYERAGLQELWLVDTVASEVMVFRRSAPKSPTFDVSLELGVEDELASPRLPGFALALSSLFAG